MASATASAAGARPGYPGIRVKNRKFLENSMQTATISFDSFNTLSDEACQERIRTARAKLGKRAVILGHHYQRADVYQHADLTGDSLKLSKLAAQTDSEYVIFCGVHFMAEVADIMTAPHQIAILPDLAAGCSMADMANLAKVERCWRELNEVLDAETEVTPVTYINSAADLKGLLRRTWRHRVHIVECRHDCQVGLRASTESAVLSRPAPWPMDWPPDGFSDG
jgi:quinolinate synthase